MEDTPPKRMTRARAAAKEAATATKPTKPTKAAATTAPTTTTTKTTATTRTTKTTKANTATTPTVASAARATSNKRKTRSDEEPEEPVQQQSTMNKPPARVRGRPKKVASEPVSEPETEPETEAEESSSTKTRTTRGRTKKSTAEPAKAEPSKTTRTRARKTATEDKAAASSGSSEPAKKVARRRAATNVKEPQGTITTTCSTNPTPGLKSAVSRPASRVNGVLKKTVTFQEPEKENRVPGAATKAKDKTVETATGMRAKPVRKPAAGGRTTRASARSAPSTTEDKNQKSPLSPKKDGHNIPMSRDTDSDDELATLEKTPLKPLLKSPIKGAPRRIEPDTGSDELGEDDEQASEPPTAVLASPVRRPPPSPYKDSMKSPAKRVDAIPSLIMSATKQDSQSLQSPSKATMLQSPAKRPPMQIKALQPPFGMEGSEAKQSPLKMSLLQSPAKRPSSPVKMQSLNDQPPRLLFGAKSSPVKEEQLAEDPPQDVSEEIPQEVPADVTSNIPETETRVETEAEAVAEDVPVAEEFNFESPLQLEFPGRLSAVLPRHADPALKEKLRPAEDAVVGQQSLTETIQPTSVQEEEVPIKATEPVDDAMDLDELEDANAVAPSPIKTTPPPQSPSKAADQQAWGLRAKDLNDQCMSDSEDELASSSKVALKHQEDTTSSFSAPPATPTPAGMKTPKNGLPSSAVKAASRAIRSVSKSTTKLAFTPLAMQLGEWKATSPLKRSTGDQSQASTPTKEGVDGNSLVQTFFDDEMRMRDPDDEFELEQLLIDDIAATYEGIHLTTVNIEGSEKAEISLLDEAGVNHMADGAPHDDSISDASQEYGDENAVPIDPALLNSMVGPRNSNLPPITPMRPTSNRNFHTVSKVPLKPADDSPPRTLRNRCASASKLPPQRPLGHSRNATVTSYVPTKDSSKMDIDDQDGEGASVNPPVTPAKSDVWSAIGTPARTPRRDLNPALLRGAVVFVDVHTSEGADASSVFIELLSQMGARCVKSWPWNPNTSADVNGADPATASSKIGITHVVYKDGGKRTMEKVRESNGVVQCVGVGWVLE